MTLAALIEFIVNLTDSYSENDINVSKEQATSILI
jgi:hypothetical protein